MYRTISEISATCAFVSCVRKFDAWSQHRRALHPSVVPSPDVGFPRGRTPQRLLQPACLVSHADAKKAGLWHVHQCTSSCTAVAREYACVQEYRALSQARPFVSCWGIYMLALPTVSTIGLVSRNRILGYYTYRARRSGGRLLGGLY